MVSGPNVLCTSMALPMILLLNWLYSCLLMFFIENSKYFQYSFNTGSTKGSTQGPRRIQHRVRGDSQHRDHGVFFSVPLCSKNIPAISSACLAPNPPWLCVKKYPCDLLCLLSS